MERDGKFHFSLVLGALTKFKKKERNSRIYKYNIINIEFIQLILQEPRKAEETISKFRVR